MYVNDIKNLELLKEMIDVEYGNGKNIYESIENAILLMKKEDKKEEERK